jgi:exopolysaccharide biosynthesis polyprenyl glycosylphosphotransferase
LTDLQSPVHEKIRDRTSPTDVERWSLRLPRRVRSTGPDGPRLLPSREAARLFVDIPMLALGGAIASALGERSFDTAALFGALSLLTLAIRGSYRPSLRRAATIDSFHGVLTSLALAALVTHAFSTLIVDGPQISLGAMLVTFASSVVTVSVGRIVISGLWGAGHLRRRALRPVLIVGAGRVGSRLAERLEEHPEYGLRAAGFLDADPYPLADRAERLPPFLGGPTALKTALEETGARHVMLAFSPLSDGGLMDLIRRCQEMGVEVSVVPRFFDTMNDRAAVEHIGGLPVIRLRPAHRERWRLLIKHSFDRTVACVGLLIGAPLLVTVAAAVKITSPGPVFFRQERVGRDGQVFDLLKFRSMRVEPPKVTPRFTPRPGQAPGGVEGADRRTPIGRFLRRSSLDELPQLINVARGEMSLVGPRPERPEFVELFNGQLSRYGERHRVKSGMTGWAQVHGLRGQTSIVKRVEWDNYYIENWSLGLDIKILFLTLAAILRSDGDS